MPDKQPIAKQLASDHTFRESHERAKATGATREPETADRDHMKDPALISTTSARLLCAMPRTGGKRGSDIVLLDRTQPGVHRLIDDGLQNMSPVLSPDGTQLAYTSYRGGAPNIYLRDLASGQDTQITSGPWLALPGTWSPNGRYLSFSQSIKGNHDIFIYDMTQKRAQRLTRHQSIDVSPSFAPDSQRLVLSSDRTGSPQLYITDIAGTTPVRLTHTGSYNTSPSWSPRDDIIAFVGRGESQALDLYTIKSDGTQRRRLTQGQRFHTPPAWLPDGQMFMGMSLRGAAWERHLVPLAPDRAIPKLPQPQSLCLAPQWVAYRAP
jgi:TolB protein